ncbi:MAG TPA: hypothetical protein V6C69_14075 [Trichormus sp.]
MGETNEWWDLIHILTNPIFIAVIVIAALAVFFMRGKYGKLFSPQHISEFSIALAKLKPLALQSPLTTHEDYSPENLEGKGFRTSQGLIVAYTLGVEYGHNFHHLSLSHESGVLAHSAAATFGAWMSYLLQIDAARMKIPPPKESPIIYINFDLNEEEESEYVAKKVIELQPVEVTQELWQQVSEPRDKFLEQLRRDPHLPHEHRI